MSADTVIENPWPRLGVDLANFGNDSSILLDTHSAWMTRNLQLIFRGGIHVEMRLIGGASRTGQADWNHELSRARVVGVLEKIVSFPRVEQLVYIPADAFHIKLSGERYASGPRANSNLGRSRAVGLEIWPLSLSPYVITRRRHQNQTETTNAISAVRAAFEPIASRPFPHGFRGAPLQGEALIDAWGRVRSEMHGFAQTIKNLLQGQICTELSRPGPYFRDAVTLRATDSAASTGSHATVGGERRDGATIALEVWNALTPDGRWGLRGEGSVDGGPPVEHGLRRELCSLFKRSFERCFSYVDRFGGSGHRTYRMTWAPGMSEIYSAQEELRDPP